MSESYISDLGPVNYGDKDGAVRRTQFQSIVFGQKNKNIRLNYSLLSDVELFIEKIKNIPNMTNELFQTIEGIVRTIDEKYPDTIKYRNVGGIVMGYKYGIELSSSLSIEDKKEKIIKIFEEGKEINVPSIDIIRYYRYLSQLKLTPAVKNITGIKMI
ncbi:MAG: hypothetical protein WCO49_20210 [Nostocales cyanobacterium ELA608]